MARASREALEKQRPTKRPFNASASGFAGAQRYGAMWVGGNTAAWDALRQCNPDGSQHGPFGSWPLAARDGHAC